VEIKVLEGAAIYKYLTIHLYMKIYDVECSSKELSMNKWTRYICARYFLPKNMMCALSFNYQGPEQLQLRSDYRPT